MTNLNNTSFVTPDINGIRSFNQDQSVNNWLVNFDIFTVTDEGVITCKASEEALNCLETQSLAVALYWEDRLDALIIGEDGCAGNYDMYTPIYITRFNCEYLILYSVSDDFKAGKTVTLYPKTDLTKEELEEDLMWAYNH